MAVVASVKRNGRRGLTLTIQSMPTDALQRIAESLQKKRPHSPKRTGIPLDFLTAWSHANVNSQVDVITKHADSYQFDEDEKMLMFSGRVFRNGQEITLDATLAALAEHIIENTLDTLLNQSLADYSHFASSGAANTMELERVVLTLHNWLFVAASVQMMKVSFELLLRRQLHTHVNTMFSKTEAGAYHAFIDGHGTNPKLAVKRMYKMIRTIQADVMGIHNAQTDD